MTGLCKYKDSLGKPGEGSHAWRIGGARGSRSGVAGVDLLLTVGAAFLLSQAIFDRKKAISSFLIVFIILMIVAVAIHRAFCVDTALNRMIGIVPAADSGKAAAGKAAAGKTA